MRKVVTLTQEAEMPIGPAPVQAFLADLAAATPVPGGGAGAAVAGAIGAALVSMLAGLSAAGPRAADSAPAQLAHEQAQAIARLLQLADADRAAFAAVLQALALPEAPAPAAAERARRKDAALLAATRVPLDVMTTALAVQQAALTAVATGRASARTDGLVGFVLAEAAFMGSLLNAATNLGHVADAEAAAELRQQAEALRLQQAELADRFHRRVAPLLASVGEAPRPRAGRNAPDSEAKGEARH